MKNLILAITIIFAIILIGGSVGAYELEHIGFKQCCIQSAIGFALIWLIIKLTDNNNYNA